MQRIQIIFAKRRATLDRRSDPRQWELSMLQRIQVIDSHTGGEPTRLVIGGGPDFGQLLAGDTDLSAPKTLQQYATPPEVLQQIVQVLDRDYDHIRRGIICEPRCSEHWVGAWLLPAIDPDNLCGVIFFNNVGYLGMCGHGTIGLMASLAYLKRVQPGKFRVETSVGIVETEVLNDYQVRIGNVPSFLYRSQVAVPLPDRAPVVGDLAWGGNWFFLTDDHTFEIEMANIPNLTRFTLDLQFSMERLGITGPEGQRIDHVELFVKGREGADSRNFVLCPGGAYDRSPCGTGTSAKLACLAADGKLPPGKIWVQESITGSRFQASYEILDSAEAIAGGCPRNAVLVRPKITGSAYVSGETSLVFDSQDPFCNGIPA